MDWWGALVVIGVGGLAVGIAGAELVVLRVLPWGKNWHVGSYS